MRAARSGDPIDRAVGKGKKTWMSTMEILPSRWNCCWLVLHFVATTVGLHACLTTFSTHHPQWAICHLVCLLRILTSLPIASPCIFSTPSPRLWSPSQDLPLISNTSSIFSFLRASSPTSDIPIKSPIYSISAGPTQHLITISDQQVTGI